VLIVFSCFKAKKKPPVSTTSGGFAVTALLQNYLFNPLIPVISRVCLMRARTTTRRSTGGGYREKRVKKAG
jgi:hypothetical protein